MVQKRVTIHDVAKEAGVSITTVSRYLNQRFEAMGEDTKNRIADVIAKLNYLPNALARGLKSNQSGTIAVIVVNISYPYCVSLIQTLSNCMASEGYNVHVCETGGDAKRETQILMNVMSKQVDAVIIQTNGDNNPLLADIAGQIPVILVDRQFDVPGTFCVVTNNRDASYQITDYLFQEGYQEILFVTEAEERISTRTERKAGYVDACLHHLREPLVGYVDRRNPQTFVDLATSVRARRYPEPLAIYTANGLLMMQLYRELKDVLHAGRRPDASHQPVGIATFDEPDWVGIVTPSMTCVHQPVEQIGAWAAKTVITQMKRGQTRRRAQKLHVLPSSLVIGESTQLSRSQQQVD